MGRQLVAYGGQLVVELGLQFDVQLAVNGAVKLVHVELAHPAGKLLFAGLKLGDQALVEGRLVGQAILQSDAQRVGEALIELEAEQHMAELVT